MRIVSRRPSANSLATLAGPSKTANPTTQRVGECENPSWPRERKRHVKCWRDDGRRDCALPSMAGAHSASAPVQSCSRQLCRTPLLRRARRTGGSHPSATPTKKPPQLRWLCYVARPEGFEPPTTWFEARYSIQLSYGRAGGAQSSRSRIISLAAAREHFPAHRGIGGNHGAMRLPRIS
jgi:hypothetical protein